MRLVLILGCLALAACGTISRGSREPAYIVQPGDTLYSIAWRYGMDYRTLASWNELENPDLILIGQRIRLTDPASAETSSRTVAPPPQGAPEEPAQVAARNSAPTARAGQDDAAPAPQPDRSVAVPGPAVPPRTPAAPEPAATGRPSPAPAATPASRPAAASQWQWPTQGPVISEFGSSEAIASGIGIGGQAGQSINAAAAGHVVYAGSGLNRYGQLVIIKHDDTFLSAYGYNDRLLVDQGDDVGQGQQIAEMGFGPERTARLHFEIRRNGVPVNPAQYLSAP